MHLNNLDLNLLVVFQAVWTHKSVSRAADELNVAQPTISSGLSRLRRYFDDPLFTWEGTRMNPTAKAQILGPEIAQIIERAENLIQANKYDPLGNEHSFTIASTDYVFAMLGAALNRQVVRDAPKMKLSFYDSTAELSAQRKILQKAELYIFPEDIVPAHGLRYTRLFTDEYVVVQDSAANPRTKRVSRQEFLDAPKVVFSVDCHRLSNHEMTEFTAQGVPLEISMMVPNYLAIPSLLKGTDLLAVLPSNVLKISRLEDSLRVLPCDVQFPGLVLGMYWDPIFENDLAHAWLRQAMLNAVTARHFPSSQETERTSR